MATEILRPNADGDYTNIASPVGAHWSRVDEETPDLTAVYTSNTMQEKDSYELEASSIPADATINSVTIYFASWTGNWSGAYIQPFLRLSGIETDGTEVIMPNDWPVPDILSEELSKPGGGDWAVSDLADLQVAIGIRANGDGVPTDPFLDTVWVVIDYSIDVAISVPLMTMEAEVFAPGLYLLTPGGPMTGYSKSILGKVVKDSVGHIPGTEWLRRQSARDIIRRGGLT